MTLKINLQSNWSVGYVLALMAKIRSILITGTILVSLVFTFTDSKGDLVGHGGMVRAIDVSADGRYIISGSFDYTARLWDFSDQSEIAVLEAHQGPVTSVIFKLSKSLSL